MAVVSPEPGQPAVRAVSQGVRSILGDPQGPFRAGRSPATDAASATEPPEMRIIAPLRCYSLDVFRDVRPTLGTVRDTGWRFLVEAAGEAVAVGEADDDADGEAAFALLEPATSARQLAAALIDAVGRFDPSPQLHEMRFLRFPDVGASALWVHGEDGGDDDDVLYPLEGGLGDAPGEDQDRLGRPGDDEVAPPQSMRAAELLDRLAEWARLAEDDIVEDEDEDDGFPDGDGDGGGDEDGGPDRPGGPYGG